MLQLGRLHDFAPGAGVDAGAFGENFDDTPWIPVNIPGDVHTALIAAGRIADPFYDRNELDCAWIEEREWWYRIPFDGSTEAPSAGERLQLVFHGLDTFATIWLNGEELGTHRNMFREAVFDVTERIRPGQNLLALRFDPPQDQVGHLKAPSWGEQSELRVSMRKAQFGYGWDWGPRLPTVGVWRPIELRRQQFAALIGVHATTLQIDPSGAQVALAVRVEADCFEKNEPLTARITLLPPDSAPDATPIERTVVLRETGSEARGTLYLTVEQPRLWWTHDLGTQELYTLRVTLLHGETTVDQQETQVGIRTLTLDQSPDPDEPGTRFFRFVLNGVPIFAKGANWIPADSFVGAIPDERYDMLLAAARDANMNTLRVWGGGIYEHDRFYDLCDQLGILVWQDFMFACAQYPEDDAEFVAEVEAEAIYQVRRLRNHASLALWCGNNENQWIHGMRYWDAPETRLHGALYYDEILPQAVAKYDGQTTYWPGSPYGGNDYNSMEDGDRHNWDVWHGNRPFQRRFGEQPRQEFTPEGVDFRNYALDFGRFISEFGMHAAPVRATLHKVIPADQRYHHSPSMDHHNKDNPKNKGDNLMIPVTGLPRDLDEYIDFSMIAQAEGLKFAIEHYRRRTPHCSGTLIWQLNDCWPVLSWSVLDYYGVGKAGYFALRRVYTPVLASFKELPDGALELWLTNDTLNQIDDTLVVAVKTFDGTTIWEREYSVHSQPNSSAPVCRWNAEELQGGPNRFVWVHSSRDAIPSNRHFFAPIKDLQREPAQLDVEMKQVNEREIQVHISSDRYAYFVYLESADPSTRYSDNYFDLAPGERRTIVVTNAVTALTPEQITVRCR